MKKTIFFNLISIFLLTMTTSLFADQAILEIGMQKYTAADLKAVMNEQGFTSPDQAVTKLQQDQVFKNVKQAKDGLIKKFFGVSSLKNSPCNESQEYLFELWLENKAKKIPVQYLNMAGYWEMVKKTDSYRIRVATGMKQSSDQIAYTFAELSLPSNQLLAEKGNGAFLTGSEFNDYITQNYNLIQAFAKRSQSAHAVRNYLIQRIAGEKILAENYTPEATKDEAELEREVQGFIAIDLLTEDPSFVNKDNLSASNMLEDLARNYKKSNVTKLNLLKNALKSEGKLDNLDPVMRAYVIQRRLAGLKKDISKNITPLEVYGVMGANKSPTAFSNGQSVLTNKHYKQQLQKSLTENGISLNLLKE